MCLMLLGAWILLRFVRTQIGVIMSVAGSRLNVARESANRSCESH